MQPQIFASQPCALKNRLAGPDEIRGLNREISQCTATYGRGNKDWTFSTSERQQSFFTLTLRPIAMDTVDLVTFAIQEILQ